MPDAIICMISVVECVLIENVINVFFCRLLERGREAAGISQTRESAEEDEGKSACSRYEFRLSGGGTRDGG